MAGRRLRPLREGERLPRGVVRELAVGVDLRLAGELHGGLDVLRVHRVVLVLDDLHLEIGEALDRVGVDLVRDEPVDLLLVRGRDHVAGRDVGARQRRGEPEREQGENGGVPSHRSSSVPRPRMGLVDASNPSTPRNAVVVLLDSLNRHLVGAYGAREFATPNLDRFARRAVRFDTHYAGSLPCMPARHDLLVRRARLPVEAVGLDRALGGADHGRAAPRRGHQHAGLGPPAPVRGGRRELPLRLQRVGLPARPRERPLAHAPGPELGRRAVVRPRPHALRRLARLLPRRGRLPGPAHARRGRALARARRAAPRALPAVRRRVRSARAVRHARALRIDVRPGVGRAAPDLAAVYTGGCRGRSADRAPGAAAPRLLRRQAHHDRPLVRRDPGRARPRRPVGLHGGDRLHRPRPLPGRARRVRQARAAGVRADGAHPPAGRLAGRRGGHAHGAHHQRRRARDPARPVRRARAPPHARPLARAAPARRGRLGSRVGALGLLGPRGPRARRAQQVRARAERPECAALDLLEPLVDDADPPRARAAAAAARRPRAARPHARLEGPGDPPAVRRRRPPALLGDGRLPRQPPLRPAPTIPRRRRTWPGSGAEKRAEELLRSALVELEVPDDQLARLGLA